MKNATRTGTAATLIAAGFGAALIGFAGAAQASPTMPAPNDLGHHQWVNDLVGTTPANAGSGPRAVIGDGR